MHKMCHKVLFSEIWRMGVRAYADELTTSVNERCYCGVSNRGGAGGVGARVVQSGDSRTKSGDSPTNW